MMGNRVGIVDTDIQSPGIHIIFGLRGDQLGHTLNNFLWGDAGIPDVVVDVTPKGHDFGTGRIFLAPSSVKPTEIARILRDGYDDEVLRHGLRQFIDHFDLDVLMIDTHPGLNQETLLSISISSALGIVLRPDKQDFEGTGVTVEVARRLKVNQMLLVVNKTPLTFSAPQVKEQVEQAYGCEVAAVFPHSDEMMTLGSEGVFSLRYPNHPITAQFKQLAVSLMK